MFRAVLALMIIASLPGISGADAADLARGADCRPFITIQKRGCMVETQLVCGLGADEITRSENYEDSGLKFVLLSMPDNRLIKHIDPSGDFGFSADLQASRATPETQLLADGKGEVQQIGEINVFGLTRPVSLTFQMRRTAPVTVKGGIVLDEFRMEGFLQMPRPMTPIALDGFTYYHAGTATWFEGETYVAMPGATRNDAMNTPAAVYLKGEPGFDVNIPTYDCNVVSMAPTAEKADRS